MRTDGENRPEALLAGMDAAPADFVVLAVAVLPRKEGVFQPPLFAHRQGTFLCGHGTFLQKAFGRAVVLGAGLGQQIHYLGVDLAAVGGEIVFDRFGR